MTARNRNWLIGIGVALGLSFFALLLVASSLRKRFEPYIQEEARLYLEKRFESEVHIGRLQVKMPRISSLRLMLSHGRGGIARVEGEDVTLRHKGRIDVPPMFRMNRFTFDVDLATLFSAVKVVQYVEVQGMEISVPPKGERPDFTPDEQPDLWGSDGKPLTVLIEEAVIVDSMLTILPKDKKKTPLHFDLHRVRLLSAGLNVAMTYEASLTNAKPPGEIVSTGTFGPWAADEPGDSPLKGKYSFDNADLGVFRGIAGILHSTGEFEGTLAAISVRGETFVPNFRLKNPGQPVPLRTRFEVLVDGTDGNTVLRPVIGTLGTTNFKTSGGILKHESDSHRTISLDVNMPQGNLRDMLTLAMKGPPLMEGSVWLQTKIDIPPLGGKVKEKLLLDGMFEITNGKFLRSTIQDQIDTLSRRGQGQPKNPEIDEVISAMAGRFMLADQEITFSPISFAVPGAGVDLKGSYDLDADVLDFHGTLRLEAKVSETMSGWKRWVLKPLDPFFSKQGAGTLLRIEVVGSAKNPKFGRDHEKKESNDSGIAER